jgi:UDP-3-O-[3-hydroxymyristoyl] N-acetylglucosamine deacetylase
LVTLSSGADQAGDRLSLQRTIAEKISCTGVGLHSGQTVGLVLCPAEPDTGVCFVRREGDRVVEIPARADFVSSTANATTLERDGLTVETVEHLLAALAGLGVDNVRVEVDGAEIPVMDGSAESFAYLVEAVGLRQQATPRRLLVVKKSVSVTDGLRTARIDPAHRGFGLDSVINYSINYAIDFAHPAIGRQVLELADLTPALFRSELARARTFGFLDQVDALREAGLARGASLENTVVLDDEGVMNEPGLRWPDEFVRHKVLDLVGDLALLGYPLRASVQVERGGHALHRALVEALLADRSAWQLVRSAPQRLVSSGAPAEYLSPI